MSEQARKGGGIGCTQAPEEGHGSTPASAAPLHGGQVGLVDVAGGDVIERTSARPQERFG